MLSSTFLDEDRHMAIPLTLASEERLQMSGDDTVERILFGIARPIGLLDRHENIGECKLLHMWPSNEANRLQPAMRGKSGWTTINKSRLFRI